MTVSIDSTDLSGRIRTLQIVQAALIMGVAGFAVLAIVVRGQGNMPPPPAVPILTYIALAYAVPIVVVFGVVPRLIAVRGRQRLAKGFATAVRSGEPLDQANVAGRLCALYQTRMIIGSALL